MILEDGLLLDLPNYGLWKSKVLRVEHGDRTLLNGAPPPFVARFLPANQGIQGIQGQTVNLPEANKIHEIKQRYVLGCASNESQGL
jgi:hypothetical protein